MKPSSSRSDRRVCLIVVATLVLLVSAMPAHARATVGITIDDSEDGTRLLLTHSESVVYAVQKSRGKIRVVYSEPVILDPSEAETNGPFLERYRMRDERTLVLQLGPRFESYESFELSNPFRLILDLQGPRRGRGAGAVRVRARATPRTIIVIDPGHGGMEEGAIGPTGVREKDVTLDIARRLKATLQTLDRSISVVLTRDEDRLVGLDERTATANHNEADLFLSIHLNASPRASASGAETYYLSTDATDSEARTLAALENRSDGNELTVSQGPDGFEQRSLDLVLWDLAQNQHLAESSALADAVQRQLNRLTGTRNRGVRQAPFRVLMGAMMPAILVEVGFISNGREEKRFKDSDYRSQVSDALAAAVREFLANLERFSAPDAR